MFPIAVFLIPYGLFLLVFLFFSFVDLTHIVKYSTTNLTTFIATFIYLAVTTLILYATYYAVIEIDWSRTIEFTFSLTPAAF